MTNLPTHSSPGHPSRTRLEGPGAPTRDASDGTRHTRVPLEAGHPLEVATPAGYQLLQEVGRGGMGVVYRARDTALNREVAVKILQDRFPAEGTAARRFVEEAAITAQLQHPGIPPIHQVGTLPGGRPFLAMKLIKGRTLADLLAERAGATADHPRFLGVFEQLCLAIGYAHSCGVIHRDVKPANVMVGKFGEVQVMDWGLAKVLGDRDSNRPEGTEPEVGTSVRTVRELGAETEAGSVLGTPAYMPPEQAGGEVERIDRRADVFALGGVLCSILSGRAPYTGKDTNEILLKAIRGQTAESLAALDACGAEPELVALCKRCLAALPDDRPADAAEVAKVVADFRVAAEQRARLAELDRVRTEGELRAAELRATEQRKRRKVQLALLASVSFLVISGGVFAWWQDTQAAGARVAEEKRQEAARADEERRAALVGSEVTAALAEMEALCDQGEKEIENPPRWRLTLTAARSPHKRAAAALEAGPATDGLRARFADATTRLEREEYDCTTAEQCEKCFEAMFTLPRPRSEKEEHDQGRAFVGRVEEILARVGPPIGSAPPAEVARAVRAHRLRYPITFLVAYFAPEDSDTVDGPGGLGWPEWVTPLVGLAPLLLQEPGDFAARVRAAVADNDRERLRRVLDTPAGRAATSRELLLLYFAPRKRPPQNVRHFPTYPEQLLLDCAVRQNPADILPLFIRAGSTGTWFTGCGSVLNGKPKTVTDNCARVLLASAAAVSLRPNSAELWGRYARNLESENLHDWAAECYRRAVELDPGRTSDYVSLARILSSRGRTAEALESYRTVLRAPPTLSDYSTGQARLAAASAAVRLAAEPAEHGAAPISAAERARLHREARAWLREWLTINEYSKYDLSAVQGDPVFLPVRRVFDLVLLPPGEMKAWLLLWEEVAATRPTPTTPDDTFIFIGESIKSPVPARSPVGIAPPPREAGRP